MSMQYEAMTQRLARSAGIGCGAENAGSDESISDIATVKYLTRKSFLKMSGAGLAGVTLFGMAGSAFGQAGSVSALDLGISPENDGVTNRENLVESLRYSSRDLMFPPGDYLIDNSTAYPERGLHPSSYVVIDGYEGELTMEEGARFVFTDKARRGLNFYSGTGATFRGLTSTFREPLPDVRVTPEECIVFLNTTDTTLENVNINGSASSGLLFYESIRPRVYGAMITNTQADGLHFANCQDAEARNISTENTGDDGLAFVNYADGPANTGGYATNIFIKNSEARGIAVVGQSDVIIDGFVVDQTSVSGLICCHDEYYVTRVPANVLFENGTVSNAGRFQGQAANKYGIEIDVVYSVEFRNIEIVSSVSRGVSAVANRKVDGVPTDGTIRLFDIEARDVVDSAGFVLVGELDGTAPASGNYYLSDLTAKDVGGTGIAVIGSSLVSCNNLSSINTSKSHSLNRAFEFGRNSLVEGTKLNVIDEQQVPTGYKVTTYEEQSGTLGKIYDRVADGDLVVENYSELDYVLADVMAPTVSSPIQRFILSSQLGASAVPIRISWSGADEAEGSGLKRYELEQSANGGAYFAVSLPMPTATAFTLSLEPGNTYRFRIRAQDNEDNTSNWAEGASFSVSAYQENSVNVSYPAGTWTKGSFGGSYGGAVKYASASGAKAKIAFTGREVAWISTEHTNRGKAEVWVDGVKETTVDLYSATHHVRQTVFRKAWTASNAHTLQVRVLGTKNASSTWAGVDVDAFLTIS